MSRLIELAARSWPVEARAAYGDELVDTTRQLAADGSTFREAAALTTAGMRARYRAGTDGQRNRVWTSGLRLALYGSLSMVLAQVCVALVAGPTGDISRWDSGLVAVVIFMLMIALTLAVAWRRAGALVATAWALAMIVWNPVDARPELVAILGVHLLLLWALTLRDARADWSLVRRMMTLTVVAVGFGLIVDDFWVGSAGIAVAITLAALVVSAWDPRLLAGATCFWLLQTTIMFSIALIQDPQRLTEIGMAIPVVVISAGAAMVTWTTRPRTA